LRAVAKAWRFDRDAPPTADETIGGRYLMAPVDPPVVTRATGLDRRQQRIGPALRHGRRLRAGIVQLVYVAAGLALGVTIPRIAVGISVPTTRATEMLVAVGAGFVPFIGIVYSMLFLVVQFGSTTFTPRLNLFRDDPIVWHAFSFFTAVIVFAFTAVFEIGAASDTTVLVPIVLGIAVLVAIALLRSLQAAAFRSIQLASILEQLSRRGREVIDGVHPETLPAAGRAAPVSNNGLSPVVETPSGGHEVLWPRRSSVLQTLDVSRLVRLAERENARIHLCVVPGQTISDQELVAIVHGARNLADREVLEALRVGSERTFDQDPALALRLLADIALRALSAAINDPTTAVQTLDAIADLLGILVRRDLGAKVVDGADRTPRVVLRLPTWDDYVSVALDEIIGMESGSVQVRRRVGRLLENLAAVAPPQHRGPVEARLATVSAPPGS
jgi:uncharacterized membrane protein